MIPEHDITHILNFCNREYIRYRDAIHILADCLEWKKAFGADYGHKQRSTYFFDNLGEPYFLNVLLMLTHSANFSSAELCK